MNKVAIIKGTIPQEMAVRALRMIGAERAISVEKRILIKPNYINASHPSTGVTTDGRVIEGVAEFLVENGFKEIIIGEGSGFADTFHAYKVAGVTEVAQRWNLQLLDLNKDEFVEVTPPNSLALKKVKIARTALESTLISIPKLKLHNLTGVTLSLKNMMGVVSPKGVMHGHLNEKIADLASIVTPKLAVIDGIIGGEVSETSGHPVEMNLLIAGTDPVAVDVVGAEVMGVDSKNVKHLQLASEKGLGSCDLTKIEVLGEPIERVRRKFRRSIVSRILS